MIRKELLETLVCPLCKVSVNYDEKSDCIVCPRCGRKYPVEDGIPIMLIERASVDKNQQ